MSCSTFTQRGGKSHHNHFFANLSKIYKEMDKSFPDVELQCMKDQTKLKCHRILLAASSDYFKSLFSWKDSDVLEVHNGISGKTLQSVLKYIYCGNVTLSPGNVSEILSAANYLSIMGLLDLCTNYIFTHLTIENCLEALLLSWQLDSLDKLLTEAISFVGNNFSYILQDADLKNNLLSLPCELVIKVLKSDELIFRDEESDLLTSPLEREKLLLYFIIYYSQNSCQSMEDISPLLACVRWPILNIFGNDDDVEGQFKGLFDVKHSKWFLSPPGCYTPTLNDKEIYGIRRYSYSELVPLATLGRNNPYLDRLTQTTVAFSVLAKDEEYIKQLDVVTKSWMGKRIVCGLKLYFACHGKGVVCHEVGITNGNDIILDMVPLHTGEHIEMVSGKAGLVVIDSIGFETSKGRKLGPFGGSGGIVADDLMQNVEDYRNLDGTYKRKYERNLSRLEGHKRIELDSILVGVTGHKIKTWDRIHTVSHLSFVFREVLPSSNFLVNNEMKYEPFWEPSSIKPMGPDPCIEEELEAMSFELVDDQDIEEYL